MATITSFAQTELKNGVYEFVHKDYIYKSDFFEKTSSGRKTLTVKNDKVLYSIGYSNGSGEPIDYQGYRGRYYLTL